jgi:hypothetical protein
VAFAVHTDRDPSRRQPQAVLQATVEYVRIGSCVTSAG